MFSLKKLALAAAIAANAATAVAVDEPVEDAALQWRYPVIVVLKHDLQYDVFAKQAKLDARAEAQPEAWQYLDAGVLGAVQTLEEQHGFAADHVYSHAVKGFAGRLTARQLKALENDPAVAMIEADRLVMPFAQTLPWGIDRVDADISSTRAGDGVGVVTGVNAYVIDTGIDTTHRDLNVVGHVNFAGGPNADCQGHGTLVAGVLGARDNLIDVVGVAPGVRQYGVKVLDCNGSGTYANVIKGIDWVKANAVRPAVANLSFGGGASAVVDDAVRRLAGSGVFVAVAAGGSGTNACNYSPARTGGGVNNGIATVGATDSFDRVTSSSNRGPCVDLYAPGLNILTTKLGGGTATVSGTSYSAAHVAGGAALYLSRNPGASPVTVEAVIRATAGDAFLPDSTRVPRLRVATF